MAASYFFYDLETSGFSPHVARIMQFAGQRTDENLEPIGEPVNVLIKLAPDVLPDPDAIMLTGITPQSTIIDGLTEAEFLKYFYDEVVTADTTFLGYNSVRFDDEFMRFLHYRNFYDPYEWHWADNCSRWDILDLVRMTRALRPDGIEWPVTDEGKPTNRLELLTKMNGLDHEHAHDALSDVTATIAIATLIRQKQPDLFDYLFKHRQKKTISELVLAKQPFIYTSGRYPSTTLHTTAAVMLAQNQRGDGAVVYDLRHDPTPFFTMTPEQLVDAWRYKKDRTADDLRLPVKSLRFNRCPAVAPLGVIKDESTQKRLDLSLDMVSRNLKVLATQQQSFARNVLAAQALLDGEREHTPRPPASINTVDAMLYDGFVGPADKPLMRAIRVAPPADLDGFITKLQDVRLQHMVPLYKARNYPTSLSAEERQTWERHVAASLYEGGTHSRLATYFARLKTLGAGTLTSDQTYLLEELQLYGESIMPSDADGGDQSGDSQDGGNQSA